MADKILWRFLVIDDRQAGETEEFIKDNRVLNAPDWVIVEPCSSFEDALESLNEKKIDLVILDLRDDSIELDDDEKPLPGEIVFEQIRHARFVPVVFYTAFPERVKHLENPYVRVIARGEERDLRIAIQDVFTTGLPRLIRHLENEQREYMWDHVGNKWQDPKTSFDKTDISYLLARRLANTLQRNSIRRFLTEQNSAGPRENDEKIHPIEMYIYPPSDPSYLAGDLFKQSISSDTDQIQYWILLTPSCDFAQGNAEKILLAECIPLERFPQYNNVQEYWAEYKKSKDEKSGKEPKKTSVKMLTQLLKDNNEVQPERFKFLPGTFFLPDLVIDFQSLMQLPLDDVKAFERITSLDNPFAEAILAKFSRYYGRLGTPDLDIEFVYNRLFRKWEEEQASS